MASDSTDWDEDLPADPEEEYQTFVRTLERTDGFRLLFVRSTPAEGEQLIARVKDDLPQKTIEVLRLQQPIHNLYEIVEQLPNREQVNILFIQGLEHSFYEYEQVKFGDTDKREFYSWKGVPRILNHLNQHRERFRDTFKICFVFLLRSFSIKYFIHRAPDFFDWRSSVFEFPTTPELLEQESSRIILEGDYEEYLTLTPEERIRKVLDIQELLEESHQTPSSKTNLLFELGNLLYSGKEYEAAITSCDQALKIKPELHEVWYNRGVALSNLGRIEEAISSYDQALKIKPDDHQPWNNRGVALSNLGRIEEAISSYDQALRIKPDYHQAWNNRGNALSNLGRIEEAISSYDQALKIKPDYHQAWNNRGNVLSNLGQIEEAISSYNQALKIKPDDHQAWNNRGVALADLGRLEEALASYDQVLKIQPDDHKAWNNRGNALADLGRLEEALASYDQALKFQPDDHRAWNIRGMALFNLGRLEEALASFDQALKFQPNGQEAWNIRGMALFNLGRLGEALASFDQALKIQPDFHEAWNNRGMALFNLGRLEEAIASFDQALKFKPDSHKAWSNRGIALSQLGKLEEAIASFDQALKFKPDLHQAWNNRGYTLIKLGQLEEALASCERAIELGNQSSPVFFNQAIVLLALNRWDEGITTLNNALNRLTDGKEPSADDTELIIRNLFNSTQDAANWKTRLTSLITLYEKYQAMSALGQGLVRSIPVFMSEMVSDKAAQKWLQVWQELGSNYTEFQIPLRLLDAAVRYREKGDKRVLLELPIEERELLKPLLEKENT